MKMVDKLQLMTTPEASDQADVSTTTIITWCRKYGIGVKIGGRWHVYPDKFKKILSGEISTTRGPKDGKKK